MTGYEWLPWTTGRSGRIQRSTLTALTPLLRTGTSPLLVVVVCRPSTLNAPRQRAAWRGRQRPCGRRDLHMQPHQALTATWAQFIDLLTAQSPELLQHIRPPAAREVLADAEQRLQRTLPEDLRHLYSLADGFVAGAYLLHGDYRLLPLGEMVEASLALVGEPVVLDELTGEVCLAKTVIRVVVAQARDDDP